MHSSQKIANLDLILHTFSDFLKDYFKLFIFSNLMELTNISTEFSNEKNYPPEKVIRKHKNQEETSRMGDENARKFARTSTIICGRKLC